MAIFRAMSILHMTSGIPEDSSVQTWHFTNNAGSPAFSNIVTAWESFQEDVKGFYPDTVARNGHELRIYDLADPMPRAPVWEETWGLTGTTTVDPLPAEVALCLSYQGERVSGETQARRRGRMYFGPLGVDLNVNGRPASSIPASTLTAFESFVDDLNTNLSTFIVYSRADETGVVVANAWVDNAWDTQRRRGLEATTRTSATITQT